MQRSEEMFANGLDQFTAVVDAAPAETWGRDSPCEGWTALDVLGHITTTVGMGISVLQGQEPTWPTFERPSDLVVGEPAAVWRELADAARAAMTGADLELMMDTPMGPKTVADRLAFPAMDLFVHAWDLGQAAGVDVEIPGEAIEFSHHILDPFPDEMMRGENGSFGPEVTPPADASSSEAFVAWTGRRPLA